MIETIQFGGRTAVGFGLSDAAVTKPIIPRKQALAGAAIGGVSGLLVGIFVGGAVYDAEGPYGYSRTGVNATGPIMAGAATAVLGAAIGAYAMTTKRPPAPLAPGETTD